MCPEVLVVSELFDPNLFEAIRMQFLHTCQPQFCRSPSWLCGHVLAAFVGGSISHTSVNLVMLAGVHRSYAGTVCC